jgi:hypothetical protein
MPKLTLQHAITVSGEEKKDEVNRFSLKSMNTMLGQLTVRHITASIALNLIGAGISNKIEDHVHTWCRSWRYWGRCNTGVIEHTG